MSTELEALRDEYAKIVLQAAVADLWARGPDELHAFAGYAWAIAWAMTDAREEMAARRLAALRGTSR